MKALLWLSLCLSPFLLHSQINPQNIQILRDSFGVPYIYAQTDAEAAYALAWVQAEDNFHQQQESLLGIKQLLGQEKGKEGILLDALSFLVDLDGIVEKYFDQSFSPRFRTILQAYTAGINRYASLHPKEIRHKALFPINEKDIVKAYVLNMCLMSNIHYDLARLFKNDIAAFDQQPYPTGSNGIAISPQRSADGKTYLVSNSHQPLEGFAAWYEVQVNSEEGWHFHGASFVAGVTPFIGTNPHLGWTHCINFDDFNDVYRLKMHPKKKLHYYLDGQYYALEKRKFKTKVKVAGIKIPISKTFYRSKHGPVLKTKKGFFALRFPAAMVVGAPEQWYNMNKAQNLAEFKEAFNAQQFVSLNTVYADKAGNIFYLNNGLFPKSRSKAYNWATVLPGDTSATLWKADFLPLEEMVQRLNPQSGYVFNMNNSGLDCTAPKDNPRVENLHPALLVSIQKGATARSERFHSLIDSLEKIGYADLKRLKYDSGLKFPIYTRSLPNLDRIRHLSPTQYPKIKDVITRIKRWNGDTGIENKEAPIFSLALQYILKYKDKHHVIDLNTNLGDDVYAEALAYAQKHLRKHFGSLDIRMGDLQKHVRGNKELPIWGIPDVITQMYTSPYKKGKLKGVLGDSYILFVTYDENGVQRMESINCYGSSNHEDSPHYTDQMQLFANKQLKSVSLNKETNLKKAEKNYHPQ